MTNKESFDWQVKAGAKKQEDDLWVIRLLVNTLIDSLYIPVLGHESVTKPDPERKKHFGIDDTEPINWGDLKCCNVVFKQDHYLVVIDEAMPDNCPVLCGFIEKYLKSFGWNIKCVTEW